MIISDRLYAYASAARRTDPVYDDVYKYKGYSSFGFVDTAETINGRAAMMGFTILFLQARALTDRQCAARPPGGQSL